MAILKDDRGNESVFNLDAITGQTITDARAATANLAANNAETTCDLNGHATLAVQVMGTWVATLSFEGTVDGTNYVAVPMLVQATTAFVTTITANAVLYGNVTGFRRVRVRVSAYTSGSAVVAMRATAADAAVLAVPFPAPLAVTILGTANAITTLSLPSAGAGLFHHISLLEVWQINGSAAAITASALLAMTTTNLPGPLAWTFANGIAAWTDIQKLYRTFPRPLKSSVAATPTTFVLPAAGAGVQWRATAVYHAGA